MPIKDRSTGNKEPCSFTHLKIAALAVGLWFLGAHIIGKAHFFIRIFRGRDQPSVTFDGDAARWLGVVLICGGMLTIGALLSSGPLARWWAWCWGTIAALCACMVLVLKILL